MNELIEELERAASVAWEHVDDGTNEQYHLGKARGLEQAMSIARAQRSRSIPQPFNGPTGDDSLERPTWWHAASDPDDQGTYGELGDDYFRWTDNPPPGCPTPTPHTESR